MEFFSNLFRSNSVLNLVKTVEKDAKKIEGQLHRQDLAILKFTNKESPEKTFEIHENVSNALNNLQVDYDRLQQARSQLKDRVSKKSKQVVKLETKISSVEKRIQVLKAYGNKLADKVEDVQRIEAREVHQPQSAQTDVTVDQMLNVLNRYAMDGSVKQVLRLPDILSKYVGAQDDNSFRTADYESITQAIPQIDNLLKKPGLGESDHAVLTQLHALALDAKEGIEAACRTALSRITESKLAALEPLNDPNFADKPFEEQKNALFAAHNLYWDLQCPLELHINLKSISEVAQRMGLEVTSKLNDAVRTVESYGHDSKYQMFEKTHPKEFYENKMAYLREKRADAIALRGNEQVPKVIIAGAGPGGLLRALTGGMKGADVEVLEKRQDFTRKNMVYIPNTPALEYFGVAERLVSNGKLGSVNFALEVSIMHLQAALADTVKDLIGDQVVKEGYDLVDIQAGLSDGGSPALVSGALFRKEGEEAVWKPADVIVDATGAGAKAAQILGNKREVLSEHSTMIAAVTEKGRSLPDFVADEARIPLQSPEADYQLILPKKNDQKAISELQKKITDVQENKIAIDQMVRRIDKAVAEGAEEHANFISIYQDSLCHRLYGRSLSGDSWVELRQAAVDRLQAYDQEAKGYKAQLDKMLKQLATHNKANLEDAIQVIAPFHIEISQRDPAIIVGSCLVEQSGDALATPDPLSGTGCKTALKGALVFGRALDAKLAGKSLNVQMRNFAYGSNVQSKHLVDRSLKVRKRDANANAAYVFSRAVRDGALSAQEYKEFQSLLLRAQSQIKFTKAEKMQWEVLKTRLLEVGDRERILSDVNPSKAFDAINAIDVYFNPKAA